MDSIVKIEHLSKTFKNEYVLQDINIAFDAGKIYGIVGKNGAGKTVLFKCMIGLLHPTEGTVTVNGRVVGKDTDFAPDTGMIIETPGFLKQYTAYDNLEYLASIRKQISPEQIREAIRMVGLDPDSKKKVGKFSLGMRQRLGIAQAIMEDPKLLVLDEPMNGLDKNGIKLVKELLCKWKDQGKAIIMASHYAEDMDICDEIYEMDAGTIERMGENV